MKSDEKICPFCGYEMIEENVERESVHIYCCIKCNIRRVIKVYSVEFREKTNKKNMKKIRNG